MTPTPAAEAAAERYLALALRWLRLRMSLVADRPVAALPSHEKAAPEACGPEPEAAEVDAAEAAMLEASQAQAAVLPALAARLGLSRFETDVLLLCAAMELDPATGARCAALAEDPRADFPTIALALRLFPEPTWDVLSRWRPLLYWHLVEIDTSLPGPVVTSPLRADPRIVHHIKGLNELDERFDRLVSPVPPPSGGDLPPRLLKVVGEAVAGWEAGAEARAPALQLLGPDAAATRLVAGGVAQALGHALFRLPAAQLATADVDLLARLWSRETALLPVALLIDAADVDPADPAAGALTRFLSRSDGAVFVGAAHAWPTEDRARILIDVPPLTWLERRDTWLAELPAGNDEIAGILASQFAMSLAEIRRTARTATAIPPLVDADDLGARLWAACRVTTRPRMESLAARIEPVARWEDLVLPEEEVAQLRRIVAHVRNRFTVYEHWAFNHHSPRGLGIAALFAGASGTGKTTAAEVLAGELRLDLCRVDLSAVVNKYIGETEKNLRRLFDAAEDGGAVLFFDEADALFGRRGEVKDSHDRYANIEVSYLLQRMEDYRGLAVLATNLRNSLDPAFLRRLRFVVTFPPPALPQRRALWAGAFPPKSPTRNLDFEVLATLPLNGGMIRNIALDAAFAAAADGGVIGMPHVLDAVRSELRKLGEPSPSSLPPPSVTPRTAGRAP